MSPSRYRTPGDSDFLEALGRCHWNFLYLEETIVRWLWLLRPDISLSQWRKETASPKGDLLGHVVKRSSLSDDLRRDLKAWRTRYQDAVAQYRNAVAHGHPFTESMEQGVLKPGLAYTDPKGRGTIVARSPEDLRDVAARIEALTLDLSAMEPRLANERHGRKKTEMDVQGAPTGRH